MGLFRLRTSIMKIELCNYSGYKVYPCRGSTYVKADGKVFRFLDGRSKKAHLLKRNPRKVTWTVLYRRKHRKGVEEETSNKRTHKFQRAIVGASLNEILAKRNQKPELRKAQRDEAIRAAKEVKKTKRDTTKKTTAPKDAKPKAKTAGKAAKNVQKAAPRVGGKR